MRSLSIRALLSTFGGELQKRISYERFYLFTICQSAGHKIATCVLRMELGKLINCQQYFPTPTSVPKRNEKQKLIQKNGQNKGSMQHEMSCHTTIPRGWLTECGWRV